MDKVKETFKTKDVNGNDIQLDIVKPGHKVAQESNMVYNAKVASLVRQAKDNPTERLLLRSEVEDYLTKLGIWTRDDAVQMEQLGLRIRACELLLKRGGMKLSEGRVLAIEMSDLRNRMLLLYSKRQQLDSSTIESIAENHRFNFLVTKCILRHDSVLPYFINIDDYIDKSSEQVAIDSAKEMAKILYGIDDNSKSNLFEIQWLRKAKFIDDQGRYINKNNELVDREGRRINNEGKYIGEDGNLIDKLGNQVDESGNFVVLDSKPFLDDETGKPIEVFENNKQPEKKKRKLAKA